MGSLLNVCNDFHVLDVAGNNEYDEIFRLWVPSFYATDVLRRLSLKCLVIAVNFINEDAVNEINL